MSRRRNIPLDHPELALPDVRKRWVTEKLFSEHYLDARIKKNDWWPSDQETQPLWEFCRDLFNRRYVVCAQNNEAFTRQELINKILDRFGFAWTDNLSIPDSDVEPDYILFGSAEEKEKVIGQSIAIRYAASAAILEAKKVNHPLSQISKSQRRFPHQQIRQYLDEAQVISWGILTNGNRWRLYCREAKPSHYFEINFAVAIQTLANFKYFLALFCPAAFVRDTQGKCRLDRVRESSISAQTELEADLRARIFGIIETLAHGFASRPENMHADDLRLLYSNCLIYLYRLLFVLYAEGRQLLPVERADRRYYKKLSLSRLLSSLKSFSDYDSHTQTRLCREVCELFGVINGADIKANKEFGVPRYNGGLFDPTRHPELEAWEISDVALADVLRQLMFTPDKNSQKFLPLESVDYADLSVQQLGSIYEGLLEHHFDRDEQGALVLLNDKAERKATGTYYTPDYIVKYIVEHTIGPLLAEIENSPAVQAGKPNAFADAVLALNILDPAMGSGHFLVDVTVHLADAISYHPTTAAVTEKDEDEQAYWRRRVVEACIYGVDLNPLAVELAKLSLWLTTIAGDQPLNFLDHHLRCGNSLIGARLDQLGKLPEKKKNKEGAAEQITFTFGPDLKKAVATAIREMAAIEKKASADVAAVKDKEKVWAEKILPALQPYKTVADLWTSTFFGNKLDEETYVATAQKILAPLPKTGKKAAATFQPLEPAITSRRFFHWELEYPEVFFDENGAPIKNPGFDAVIGNPPYENAWNMTGLDDTGRSALMSCCNHPGMLTGHWDLYVPFISRALSVLRRSGLHSFIVPDALAREKYAAELRRFLMANTAFKRWTHFEGENVFAGVSRHCVIYTLQNRCPTRTDKLEYVSPPNIAGETKIVSLILQSELMVGPAEQFRPDAIAGLDARILKRIDDKSVRLGQFCYVMVGATMHSKDGRSFKKADILGSTPVGNAHPFVDGKTISRYKMAWDGRYMDYRRDEMYGPRYPELFECEKLLVRKRTAEHEELISLYDGDKFYCDDTVIVVTPYENLEGTGAQTEYEGFERLKEPLPDIRFVLSLLNSKLLTFIFKKHFATGTLQGSYSDVYPQQVRAFPICRIDFKTPSQARARLLKQGQKLYEASASKRDLADVVEFAQEQLAAKRADVVHDLLAFLAERMTAMNAEKNEAARKFLGDLKDFHGVDAHSLKPKTKLDEFWKLETAHLFAHLRANAKLLAAQNVRLKDEDDEKIRARFQKAKESVLPLETALAYTDNLIDQLVYRLYGLDDTEIAVIETA